MRPPSRTSAPGLRAPHSDAPPEDYRARLLRHVPADVVAGWAFLDGLLRADPHVPRALPWGVLVAVASLTPLLARRDRAHGSRGAKRDAAVATLAFVVWAFALGGPFEQLRWYTPTLASIALALFTLAAPLLTPPHARKRRRRRRAAAPPGGAGR